MEFEIVNRDKMKLYMKCWNYISWEEVTDNYGMLNSDCVALGIREGNIPLGIVIGEMTDEQIEIKIFQYSSIEAVSVLMKKFRNYCKNIGINNILYEIAFLQEDRESIEKLMENSGLSKPLSEWRIYNVKRESSSLLDKANKKEITGTIYPFFDTTLTQRVDLMGRIDKESVLYRGEDVPREYSVAYVEENKIEGYILSTYYKNCLCVEEILIPRDTSAWSAMILEISRLVNENGLKQVYIKVRKKKGEQLVKVLFKTQITQSWIVLSNKEEKYNEFTHD